MGGRLGWGKRERVNILEGRVGISKLNIEGGSYKNREIYKKKDEIMPAK